MRPALEAKVFALYKDAGYVWTGNLTQKPEMGTEEGKVWFKCSDGDHGAYNRDSGPFLYCPICDKHWWLDKGMGGIIKQTIFEEESKFRRLLDRFKDLNPMSPEEAFRLHDERGCPLELLEEKTDFARLLALCEEKSDSQRVKREVYA
jgi:hypothetical protein